MDSILGAAGRDARKLAKNPVLGSAPMASLLLSAIAHVRGDKDTAKNRLADGVTAFDALDMRAFAAASKRMLGRLEGGAQGGKLMAEADAFMAGEGIVNAALCGHARAGVSARMMAMISAASKKALRPFQISEGAVSTSAWGWLRENNSARPMLLERRPGPRQRTDADARSSIKFALPRP
jgi:hypothetical protein